jgi:hypothetical protein
MHGWIVVLVMGNLAFSGFFLWLIFQYKLKRRRNDAEERERLLARFGTSEELVDFLSSPAGERFFRTFAPRSSHPVKEVGGALKGGIILLSLGLAFLILAWAGIVGGEAFYIPGTLLTMIGLGTLASAAISARLLRRSGLLPRNGEGRGADPF